MPSLLTIRRLLSALAIMGLVISPVAKPAIAMAGALAAVAPIDHSDRRMDGSASMGEMPCCPDEIPAKSDCMKDCPLMALCMAKTMQNVTDGFALPIQFAMASVIFPGEERNPAFLLQSPPAKPPRA